MKTRVNLPRLFLVSALALAASSVHAASWQMTADGNSTRLSQDVSLTLGNTADTLAHSATPIPGALVDASGFFAFDAGLPFALTDGAARFNADFAHQASGNTDSDLDGKTAQLKINTLAGSPPTPIRARR